MRWNNPQTEDKPTVSRIETVGFLNNINNNLKSICE